MKDLMIRLAAAILVLAAFGTSAHQAHAAGALTLTVTTTFDGDDPTPTDAICDTPIASPAAGKCSLRAAVDTANNQGFGVSTTINVPTASQHYLLAATLGEIVLANDAGGTITINGAQRTGVVVDGGGVANITDFRVQSDATIRNLTITGGNNPQVAGVGGVAQLGGNLTLTNVRITGNVGNLAGGLSQAGAGTLTITNAEIDHNSTAAAGFCPIFCPAPEGGGLTLNGGGNTTLAYDYIAGNSTVGFGGGIYAGNVLATVIRASNLVIAGNSAQINGGGIAAESLYGTTPQMILTDSVVENNVSQNPAMDLNTSGGGIYSDTFIQLVSTQVIHNMVGYPKHGVGFGGGIANGTNGTSGLLLMTGGTVSGNVAGNWGGGLDNEFTATLNGVPVTGNHAGDVLAGSGGGTGRGGGIYTAPFSTLQLEGGSVAGNDAGLYGGGIGVFTHDVQIDGTKISTNVAGGQSGCPGFGGGLYMDPFNDVPPTLTLPHPGIHAGIISSNTAEDSAYPSLDCPGLPSFPCSTQGGGVYVTNATLLVDTGTHVDANRSCDGGGITLGSGGGLTFSGVESLNVASGAGGAMYLGSNSLGATITGSRIAGNRAMQTGGIYNLAPVTITTSLVAGNTGSSPCLNVLNPCL
jgi:CSLREA domain-containing protein